MLRAILSHVGLSYAILEAILGSPRPSWSHLGPSWTPQRVAAPPVQVQGRGQGERAGTADRGCSMEVPTRALVFGGIFCLKAKKRWDLVTKMNAFWSSMRRGAQLLLRKERKGPTHTYRCKRGGGFLADIHTY